MFAALAAFLTFVVQRRELLESVRPELLLSSWTRDTTPGANPPSDRLLITYLQNVGRGTAFHVRVHCIARQGGTLVAVLPPHQIPIVAVAEQITIAETLTLLFQNVVKGRDTKTLGITVHATCWDSRGTEYDVQYRLFILEPPKGFLNADELAHGVRHERIVVVRAAWRTKLRSRVTRGWHAVVRTAIRTKLWWKG
jgi:hypothetical protein